MAGVHRTVSVLLLGVFLAAVLAIACASEPEVIVKEVVVEKEVVKEVEVPGQTVVKEVVQTVEVPGETVVVTETVEVPGETIVVTETVVQTVEVPGETVVVTETVEVPGETIVVTETVEVPGETVFVIEKVEVPGETVIIEAPVPMVRPVPGSNLTIAAKDVGPPGWHRPLVPTSYGIMANMLGASEHLLDYGLDGSLVPMIAREFEVNETGITWTLRPGVPWHDPAYGTLKAEDVHWSFENGSREGSLSTFTSWYRDDYQNMRIVDDETIQWDWGESGPTIRYIQLTRCCTGGTPIENKDYYDDVGEETHSTVWMGTGPYRVTSHIGDDIITMEAVPNHWRKTADWEAVRIIEVPEQSTRIALMKGGQADVTDVGMSLLDQIVNEPGIRLVEGRFPLKRGGIFYMGGNWQIQTLMSGDPNTPAHVENPWVGDPNDEADLERARNVRRALSFAIDREALNEHILFGQGCLGWVYTIDSCNPNWQDRWGHPYDVDKAKEYLALGGFPDGFEMPLYIPTGPVPDTMIEVAEAIIPMWEEIGIEVKADKSAWASREKEFFRGEPMFRDVAVVPWGGNNQLEYYPDYLCDLIDTCTKWNSGYDHPVGYDIRKNFSAAYEDTVAAWDSLIPWWEYHSWQGDLPVLNTVSWVDPYIVGPRIGLVDMVEHSQYMVQLAGLHIAP